MLFEPYVRLHIYAPNFEEFEGAYWFGSVCACVRAPSAKVTLTLGQEPLELGSRNFVCSLCMKIKRTRIFSCGKIQGARGPFCESCELFELRHCFMHFSEWIEGTLCAQLLLQFNTDTFETL